MCYLQAAARSHAAREAEINSREAALEAAQQQLEQQSMQLQVRPVWRCCQHRHSHTLECPSSTAVLHSRQHLAHTKFARAELAMHLGVGHAAGHVIKQLDRDALARHYLRSALHVTSCCPSKPAVAFCSAAAHLVWCAQLPLLC